MMIWENLRKVFIAEGKSHSVAYKFSHTMLLLGGSSGQLMLAWAAAIIKKAIQGIVSEVSERVEMKFMVIDDALVCIQAGELFFACCVGQLQGKKEKKRGKQAQKKEATR